MKKFGFIIAALGVIAIAAPTIASAETIVIKRGGHGHGARAQMHMDRGMHRGWRHHNDRKVVIIKRRHHHGY